MQISQLPSASSVANNDVFVKENNAGVTQKVTAQEMLCYTAGDTVQQITFRTMGRVRWTQDAIYAYLILDKRVVASSFAITIGGIGAFNGGSNAPTFNTPISITKEGNSGDISGNTLSFDIPITNTPTGGEIYLLEMSPVTITFS